MVKLSSTSALVLLWAGKECYKTKKSREFLNQLDLEDGMSLYKQCEEICPYYDQVIKNRKFGVLNLIEKSVPDKNTVFQLIIPGAGLDPLGIEVGEIYPNSKVFELDEYNMKLKSELYNKLGNGSKSNINFIETSLSDPSSILKKLTAHSWNQKFPTLMIFEGISYYLTDDLIQQIAMLIKPDWMILEFLKQDKDVAPDKVMIPEKIFSIVSNQCELPFINRYSYSKIERLFDNMTVMDKFSMKRLENMRTGSNKYFMTENSGWIEVCLLRVNPVPASERLLTRAI